MTNELQDFLNEIYEEIKENNNGKVADYIPQLAKVNPNLFGISACTVDGKLINIGDTDFDFCLQSCSKPLIYSIVRELYGSKKVHSHVGYEPSGQEFNAFVLNKKGLPHNPMINAGAIMTSSLLKSDEEPAQRFDFFKKEVERMSGKIGKISFDNSVFLSEKQHADRNMSLAYYMRENGAFDGTLSPSIIQEHLDLYFQCCSVDINCKIGSVLCGTLAKGGICPINNEKIYSIETVRDCITLMYNCGMYDFSGQFSFEIGLPAKSGVSGCIFLVIPNVMGVCIFSPLLDDIGNSVRGIEVCRRIVSKYHYHIFENIIRNGLYNNQTNNLVKESDRESDREGGKEGGKEGDNENDIEILTVKLINAATTNDCDMITKCLQKIDVNSSDYDKRTPLHLACAEGNFEAVEVLLLNGGECNIKDRWGNTPLSEINGKEGENYSKIRGILSQSLNC
jgi:glutaminase